MKKKRETRCTLCNDKTLATAFGRYVEAFEPHAKCGDEETLAATRVPSAARATPKLSGTPPASRGRPAQPRPTPRSLRTPPRPDRHQRQEGHTRGQPRERVCRAAGHPLAEPVTEAAEHSPSHVRPCLHDSLGIAARRILPGLDHRQRLMSTAKQYCKQQHIHRGMPQARFCEPPKRQQPLPQVASRDGIQLNGREGHGRTSSSAAN